jgi:hypothetical protein
MNSKDINSQNIFVNRMQQQDPKKLARPVKARNETQATKTQKDQTKNEQPLTQMEQRGLVGHLSQDQVRDSYSNEQESRVTGDHQARRIDSQADENDSALYHQQSSAKMVRKAIVDLFLNVKIRSQEEIASMTEEAIEQEKLKLQQTDTIDILDYIKQSIEILMHMRIEEFELFKKNWEIQEKLKTNKLEKEKDALKRAVDPSHQKPRSRLLEKLNQELLY